MLTNEQLIKARIAQLEQELNDRHLGEFQALELIIATTKGILDIRRNREQDEKRNASGKPIERHARIAAASSPNRKN